MNRAGMPRPASGDELAAVRKLQEVFRINHGVAALSVAKGAVGGSDLDDAIGDPAGGKSVAPSLRTRSAADFLLEHGASSLPPSVRLLSEGAPAVAGWLGRGGKAIRVSKISLAQSTMVPFLVGALAVAARESVASSEMSPVLARILSDAIDDAVDEALLAYGSAGVADEYPAGLLNGCPTVASGGTAVTNVAADFENALATLSAMGSNLRQLVVLLHAHTAGDLATWRTTEGVAAFPEMTPAGGTLFGMPAYATARAPVLGSPWLGSIQIVDASDVAIVDIGARPSLSTQTSIEMSDAPTGDTTTPTAASSLISMFQADATAIKIVRGVNWKLRRGLGVTITGVSY